MEKINYFGMYLGAKVRIKYESEHETKYEDKTLSGLVPMFNDIYCVFDEQGNEGSPVADCTLLLRQLSSLTDDEKVGWYDAETSVKEFSRGFKIEQMNNLLSSPLKDCIKHTSEAFSYLLSLHIDLFGLVEKGWAKIIDNTKTEHNGK